MSEPIITKENHEGKIHFPLQFNTGFNYNKNDVHIGTFEDNISFDIRYAFKGHDKWMAYWTYLSYQQPVDYIYLCVKRTGTFNGQCTLYLAEVYEPGDFALNGPVEANILGPNPSKYDFTITAPPGEWQIIKVDVRSWFAGILQGSGGIFAYANLDDMNLIFTARRPLYIVLEPKGTAGNTWEIALIDSPAKYQPNGMEILPSSLWMLEHWGVSPDATQGSWKIPVEIADPPLSLDEGGLFSCIQFVPYVLFEPNGTGLRMRKRYEMVDKMESFKAGHTTKISINTRSIAQSFTPTKDISLDTFSFVGNFNGTNLSLGSAWFVDVYLDNGGDPDQTSNKIGQLRYFDSLLLRLRGDPSGWFLYVNMTFMAPNLLQLTAGTKYWFVLKQEATGSVFDVEPELRYIKEPEYTEGQIYAYKESAWKAGTGPWTKYSQRSFLFFIISHKYPDPPVSVEFPNFTPAEVVESWNRLSHLKEGSPKLYFQASNDNGLGYGVSPPDYNDAEWLEYLAEQLKGIETDQNGKDRLRIKVELTAGTDKLIELYIYYYLFGKDAITQYTPKFLTKQDVASKSDKITVDQVSDAALMEGEIYVINTLLSAPYLTGYPIDYNYLLTQAAPEHIEIFRSQMKFAGAYRSVSFLNKQGIGNTISGPLQSVAADGMSKSFGYSSGLGWGKQEGVTSNFEELAAQAMLTLVKLYYSLGYGPSTVPIGRRNEFLESDYWHTGPDVRRRFKDGLE